MPCCAYGAAPMTTLVNVHIPRFPHNSRRKVARLGTRNLKFVKTSTETNAHFQNAGIDTCAKSASENCLSNPASRPAHAAGVIALGHSEFWAEHLEGYHDKQTLLDYIHNGVNIGYTGPRKGRVCPNWPSAAKYGKHVRESMLENTKLGRMSGPFPIPPSEQYIASPLGAFQKCGATKVRTIHDLSWPPGQSINDGISPDECSLEYTTVDKATELCKNLSDPYMCKIDLSDAFLYCVVRQAFLTATGCEYWYSNVLSFGLRSSPMLFDRFGIHDESSWGRPTDYSLFR